MRTPRRDPPGSARGGANGRPGGPGVARPSEHSVYIYIYICLERDICVCIYIYIYVYIYIYIARDIHMYMSTEQRDWKCPLLVAILPVEDKNK